MKLRYFPILFLIIFLAGCGRMANKPYLSNAGADSTRQEQSNIQTNDPAAIDKSTPESIFFDGISPYAVTEKNAVIYYKTSSPAVKGEIHFGRDALNLAETAVNFYSGKENYATLMGLDPEMNYYYKIKAQDASGNIYWSNLHSFRSRSTDLALGKSVSGTFTELPPNDPYVNSIKDVLSRVTDGVTGYFEGMATSRSILNGDQLVTIDLGSTLPLNSIISYWRALAYPKSFSVRISDDNINWKEISSNINAESGAFSRSDAGDPMRVVSIDAKGENARYVQIFILENSPFYVKHPEWDFVQLMEVQVYSSNQ